MGKILQLFFLFLRLASGFLWRMTREFKKEKHVLSLGCRCRPSLPVVCLDFFCHCNQVARLVLLLLVQLISSFLTIPFQSRLYFTSIYNLLLFQTRPCMVVHHRCGTCISIDRYADQRRSMMSYQIAHTQKKKEKRGGRSCCINSDGSLIYLIV